MKYYFTAYGARWDDNNDDEMWFGGQKVDFDHKMLWFASQKWAKIGAEKCKFWPDFFTVFIDDKGISEPILELLIVWKKFVTLHSV